MTLEKLSPCKVNLVLNILGKRADGFHELETLMHPVRLFDRLTFERGGTTVQLSCGETSLPVDSRNLVYRTAAAFLDKAGIGEGVRLHLEKNIPLAAGLGGGSGNAATTLLGMNELFGTPLPAGDLHAIAAGLGSDIPFFLQERPALATGRGEKVESLEPFPVLRGGCWILIHPGFGIATPWAYQELARFPEALQGRPGRAAAVADRLRAGDLAGACSRLYNSLEAPALDKYPVLALYQEFFRENGALGTLMSGSGSTTFALMRDLAAGNAALEKFRGRFGKAVWGTVVEIR
jgi:4-diphosphocytidyl-2-C-methyl-D-erythritol kinase